MWDLAIPILKKVGRGIVGKVLKDKVSPDILDSAVKAVDEMVETDEEIRAGIREWYEFNLAYFGAAENLPRAVQIIRAAVRPFMGIGFTVLIGFGFVTKQISGDIIVPIFATIVGFYFCERALKKPPKSG